METLGKDVNTDVNTDNIDISLNAKIDIKNTTKNSINVRSSTEKYSDKQLYALCRKYGTQALLWRQKFIGLLPEVNRRRLYEKKGFGSIFEFGKRIAGLSEAQIRLALNLDKRFSDKPALKAAFVQGKISIN